MVSISTLHATLPHGSFTHHSKAITSRARLARGAVEYVPRSIDPVYRPGAPSLMHTALDPQGQPRADAGAGQAAAVAPARAARGPDGAGIAAGCVEPRTGNAVGAGQEVLALQLQRTIDPHCFDAGGGEAVDVVEGAGVDDANGRQVG